MSDTAKIIRALGGEKVLGRKVKSTDDLVELVHRGLPYQSFDFVSRSLSGEVVVVATIKGSVTTRRTAGGQFVHIHKSDPFGIPPRTLARRRTEHRLSPEESDRVLRVARIMARAEEVFGAENMARNWLSAPCRALGGKIPANMLDTDLGAKTVDDELTRIAHGVYA